MKKKERCQRVETTDIRRRGLEKGTMSKRTDKKRYKNADEVKLRKK